MAREEWSKLGLSKDKVDGQKGEKSDERVEKGGFVAGARMAKRRKERYMKGDDSFGNEN